MVRSSRGAQHLETLSAAAWCPATKTKIDFTESWRLWFLGRNQAVEGNWHRGLFFYLCMEQILPNVIFLCPLITWHQSNKLEIHTKGDIKDPSSRGVKATAPLKSIYPASTSYLLRGKNNGERDGNWDLCFLPRCLHPWKAIWGAEPGLRALKQQWGGPFENRLFSLGERTFSQLLQTPPIYNCLHITLTIYLKSWGSIYFILETDRPIFSRGPLFFPWILLWNIFHGVWKLFIERPIRSLVRVNSGSGRLAFWGTDRLGV